MKPEAFIIAKRIEYEREKLRLQVLQLQRPISVTIHGANGSGSYNFATISHMEGVGTNCEHPDTDAVAVLITQMILRRTDELEALTAEFNAL